jgi:hypothetical protein
VALNVEPSSVGGGAMNSIMLSSVLAMLRLSIRLEGKAVWAKRISYLISVVHAECSRN